MGAKKYSIIDLIDKEQFGTKYILNALQSSFRGVEDQDRRNYDHYMKRVELRMQLLELVIENYPSGLDVAALRKRFETHRRPAVRRLAKTFDIYAALLESEIVIDPKGKRSIKFADAIGWDSHFYQVALLSISSLLWFYFYGKPLRTSDKCEHDAKQILTVLEDQASALKERGLYSKLEGYFTDIAHELHLDRKDRNEPRACIGEAYEKVIYLLEQNKKTMTDTAVAKLFFSVGERIDVPKPGKSYKKILSPIKERGKNKA